MMRSPIDWFPGEGGGSPGGGAPRKQPASAPKYTTAVHGMPIPIVYGTARVAPRVVYFKALGKSKTCWKQGPTPGTWVRYEAPFGSVVLAIAEAPLVEVLEYQKQGERSHLAAYLRFLCEGGPTSGDLYGPPSSSFTLFTSGTPPDLPWLKPEAIGMRFGGTAFFAAERFTLTDDGKVPDITFTSRGRCLNAGGIHADPALVLVDLLTHPRYGLGRDASEVVVNAGIDGASASSYSTYCAAAGWGVSRAVSEQEEAADLTASLMDCTNSMLVPSGGRVIAVPRADLAVGLYSPPAASVVLNADELLRDSDEDPVAIERTPDGDVYSAWPVRISNREANYESSDIEQPDPSAPFRRAPAVDAAWLTDPIMAKRLSSLLAQRSINVRNTYTFRLPSRWALLEPGDYVSLTESVTGLSAAQCRIARITTRSDGTLEVEAEEAPEGHATPIDVTPQAEDGFSEPIFPTHIGDQTPIATYMQPSAPTGALNEGDLWIDTDDNNHLWRWSGTAWVSARDENLAAKVLTLYADSQLFKVAAGGVGSPTSIGLAVVPSSGLTGTATWAIVSGTATLTGSTANQRTLTFANMTTDAVTIRATITDGGVDYTDQVTVVKVYDGAAGADAVTAILTNESATVPANADGSLPVGALAGAVCTIRIFVGATDDSAAWTVSKVDGPGVASSLAIRTVTVTAIASDTGYVDLTATKGALSLTKRFTLSKSRAGATGATGATGSQGPKGDTGSQGIPGTAGANGQTTYLHIAWALNANGTAGFSTSDPTGRTYVGYCTDYNAVDPETPASYVWQLVQGPQGPTGATGSTGPTGSTGAPGSPGAAGARGSMTFYVDMGSATSWSGTSADAATAPYGGNRVGDTVTEYSATTSPPWTTTRFWSSTAWVSPGLVIDGSLAVRGSIAADALAADALRTSNYVEVCPIDGQVLVNKICPTHGLRGDGIPTSGAKLDKDGNALKVAPLNTQIGRQIVDNLWWNSRSPISARLITSPLALNQDGYGSSTPAVVALATYNSNYSGVNGLRLRIYALNYTASGVLAPNLSFQQVARTVANAPITSASLNVFVVGLNANLSAGYTDVVIAFHNYAGTVVDVGTVSCDYLITGWIDHQVRICG